MTDFPCFARILLVTDFSACSEAVIPYTQMLAEHYGATVSVAHVIAEAEATPGATGSVAEAEARMRKFLAASTLAEMPVETLIERGPVAEVVAAIIHRKEIDLVAIGTHGRSGVGKLLLGSVAQRVFNFAVCPVLSVSPRAGKPSRQAGEFATILYPTDFSGDSLKALPYALSLARIRGSKLVLLHAAGEEPRHEVLQEYYKRLNAVIPPHDRTWCNSDTLVVRGTPAEVILRAAAEQSADFIVLSAHRAEGRVNVPLTTAYQVVAHAPCAVLRVRC